MTAHPHAGRIAAVAHLSAARALIDCAYEALDEHRITIRYDPDPDAEDYPDVRDALDALADDLMRPCEVANVLQTVEEVIAVGAGVRAVTGLDDGPVGRAEIVRGLVDARLAAKEDEPDEDREPTDDEIYNRHGMEGGIGYRTEPSMEDLLREKGDL